MSRRFQSDTWSQMDCEVKAHLQQENPLAKALASGLPVIADFGRGTCIPCKMMKPILEELMETYKGKAEIFIFDTKEGHLGEE